MSLVKQALIIEIRKHIKNAVDFKQKIDNAKTEAKKNVYKKKLKKNNIEAADLFTALDKLLVKEAIDSKAAIGDKDEVSVLEGRTTKTDGSGPSLE
ncbi:MAG: hypothetical protein KGI25_09575 [Thaumarchaeota archaeon]|nr:hypothetical protein [Nitrososphaerota archaeon]